MGKNHPDFVFAAIEQIEILGIQFMYHEIYVYIHVNMYIHIYIYIFIHLDIYTYIPFSDAASENHIRFDGPFFCIAKNTLWICRKLDGSGFGFDFKWRCIFFCGPSSGFVVQDSTYFKEMAIHHSESRWHNS